MIFLYVKQENTKMQICKYTNTEHTKKCQKEEKTCGIFLKQLYNSSNMINAESAVFTRSSFWFTTVHGVTPSLENVCWPSTSSSALMAPPSIKVIPTKRLLHSELQHLAGVNLTVLGCQRCCCNCHFKVLILPCIVHCDKCCIVRLHLWLQYSMLTALISDLVKDTW